MSHVLSTKRVAVLAALLMILNIGLLAGCGQKKVPDEHIQDAEILVEDVDAAAEGMEPEYNPNHFPDVPTQVNKIGETYFLVDCYNDQVVFSDDVCAPLYEWKVMASGINKGHTVASDGVIYLVDDTENNCVQIFERRGEVFVNSQVLKDIGLRPHYIVYDETRDVFYAWSSLTGQMYVIRRDKETNQAYVCQILSIEELNGVYVRSFTIIGDDIYFVSGNCQIIQAALDDFEIENRYVVPLEMAGMVQIMPAEDQFLITISTDANGDQSVATIIQAEKLEKLYEGEYKDVYENFVGGGTPYYMTKIDDTYYLTEHRVPGHSVWSFEFKDGEICNVKAIF